MTSATPLGLQPRLLPGTTTPILELAGAVSSLQDALAVIAAGHETGTTKVLLRGTQLPPAFFGLKTRFAGEFVQKPVNYRLSIACVFDERRAVSERFRGYVGEAVDSARDMDSIRMNGRSARTCGGLVAWPGPVFG